jgi:NTE family protein
MVREEHSDALERILGRLFDDSRGAASWFTLPGGVRLYAAGDAADTLYLLRAGRLGVFKHEEGQEPHFIGVIRPGEPAGEMSMIAGTAHTATVVALRDSEILALPREAFFAAAAVNPELMTELARLMILRARQSASSVAEPTVFGFIGQSEQPVRDFVQAIEQGVQALGFSVKTVTSSALRSAAEWFSAVEENHDFVLYVAERDELAWAHLCARQVDRLFLVGRSGDTPMKNRAWEGDAFDNHRQVDLILLHPPSTQRPSGTSKWLDATSAARWFHIREGDKADSDRIARVLTGTSVGVVLSGGGARAYACIGAVKALREAKVPIDFVGGASMGAIVCAGVAMGWSQEELDARIRKAFVESSPIDDVTIPILSLVKGKKVDARLQEHYGETLIDDLWFPFYCVSSNITSGGYVVHKRGLLRRALRASIAIPGVLPPVLENGAVLVDGAVLRNFPVDIMRAWHMGPVVGCDVSRARGVDPHELEVPSSWWKWLLSGAWRRQGPPIVAIMIRSATLTAKAELMEARNATDLLIIPGADGVEVNNWKAYDRGVHSGWTATNEALSKLDGPVTFLRRRKLKAEHTEAVDTLRLSAPEETAARKATASRRRPDAEKPAKAARGKRPKTPPVQVP